MICGSETPVGVSEPLFHTNKRGCRTECAAAPAKPFGKSLLLDDFLGVAGDHQLPFPK